MTPAKVRPAAIARIGPDPLPGATPCIAIILGIGLGLLLCACSQTAPAIRAPASSATVTLEAPAAGTPDPPAAGTDSLYSKEVRTDDKVRIRLHNLSDSLPLTDILVRFPSDSARIGFIAPRAYSDYFAVDSAYRYAFIQAKSGGKDYFCQPADFTGETPLLPGRYTYELSQVKNRDPDAKMGFFLLELIEDKGHP